MLAGLPVYREELQGYSITVVSTDEKISIQTQRFVAKVLGWLLPLTPLGIAHLHGQPAIPCKFYSYAHHVLLRFSCCDPSPGIYESHILPYYTSNRASSAWLSSRGINRS